MTQGARGARQAAPRVRIREARVADAPALAAVRRSAVLGLARGADTVAALRRWASLPPLYDAWAMTAGGETLLVAERRGRAVGFAGLRGAELTSVFVRPSAQREGLGARLVDAVERRAGARGVARLRVRAAASAVPFYRALGYRGGRAIRVPLPGGGALAAIAMWKPIGARPSRRSR